MRATVFSQDTIIGTADLQVGDFTMGGLFGEFYPTEHYYLNIQKTVWKFWASRTKNYKEWNALRLNVQLENGVFLFPVDGLTIDHIEDYPAEKQLSLAGVATDVIERFVIAKPPKTFVEEPWVSLSINQKLAFEDELFREVSPFKIPEPDGHILKGAGVSALCRSLTNDDVLYEIQNSNLSQQFALVHLTWTGKAEQAGFPRTVLFDDLQTF